MVAETHPDDSELFDYVENDLSGERRGEIEAHLAGCSVCSEQVELVTMGRDALHDAQFMHLPARRAEGVLMNLPTQAREPGKRRALTPKQLIAVLTPVIAVAAVIGVLSSNGTPGRESAGATSRSAEAAAGGAGAATDAQKRLFAAGPAAAVADELRSKGFDAVTQADRVVVRGASKKAVRTALADRGPGDVQIVVLGR
ncbi:MAG TPA: zf-HC2 domain-containing protein [Gaiellaceae bacterium]|jgi:anti-sigma factor RsiW|nr:zf-HC2 domain-containing protein [Gaiellaceae bacterium]